MDKLKQYLDIVISGLVSNPDKIVIESKEDEQGILLSVSVAQEDIGKVIGKAGSIANAIRTILRSAGHLLNARVSLKIDVPNRE